MRQFVTILLACLCLSIYVRGDEPAKRKYVFTLDGEVFRPDIISLSARPEQPQPGDLIYVNGLWIVLDDDPTWDLVTTSRDEGILYRKRGKERETIAVSIRTDYKGDQRALINPLTKMTGKEKARVRGVWLDAWDEAVAKSLASLPTSKIALTISDDVRDKNGVLAELPADLRYLSIEEHSNRGITDYSRLANLKSLVALHISAMTIEAPPKPISGLKSLRYLDVFNMNGRAAECLGELTELRTLQLRFSRSLSDIGFVQHCKELVSLDVRYTQVADLRPVNGLQRLESVRANETKVSQLPKRVPNLRELEVFTTELTDEFVAAFQKDHPQCQVRHRWQKAMVDELGKADRMRIRSGGTCHREIAREKTLLEVKDAKVVKEFLSNININETQAGEHCQCCGNPSIEFYEGDRLVLTLGFHHGRSLRWVDNWPSDGVLETESADKLCKWMAEHGIPEPLKEWEQGRRSRAAGQRRAKLIEENIPKEVLALLKKVQSQEDVVSAFETGVPDAVKRAEVYFRVLGCGQGSWNHIEGAEDLVIRGLLPTLKPEQVAAAAKNAKEPAALAGAARWLFSEKKWEQLGKDGLDDVVRAPAEFALGQPHLLNRRQTMSALAKIGTTQSRALLRNVFDSKIKIRKPSPEDRDEPAGMVSVQPNQDDLERGSDAAQAARYLAQLGEKGIRDDIQKRLAVAQGADKDLYAEALSKLEKK